MTNKQYIGVVVLRLTLAFVFLWFGFSQISNAAMWTSFVPEWATHIMDAGTLVLLNGTLEIVAGIMLGFGILSQYVALVLGIHLFIIASSLGFSAIGVRDIGLSLASIALFFFGSDPFSLVVFPKNKISN